MKTRTAFLIFLLYVAAVVTLTLSIGSEPTILGVPLDTFVLCAGLFLTPIPTWILALTVQPHDVETAPVNS